MYGPYHSTSCFFVLRRIGKYIKCRSKKADIEESLRQGHGSSNMRIEVSDVHRCIGGYTYASRTSETLKNNLVAVFIDLVSQEEICGYNTLDAGFLGWKRGW